MTKSIPEKSADTAILEEMIRRLEPGDTLTYDDMSKALGRDVREHCRGNMTSAKRAVENQDGIVLAAVQNVGYKRLRDDEIVESSPGVMGRIRRASKKHLQRLAGVKYQELSDEHKLQHTAAAAQAGAINLFSSGKAKKKIESKVNGQARIPIGDTLRLFTD